MYHCYSSAVMIIRIRLHGENCISIFLYSDGKAWMLQHLEEKIDYLTSKFMKLLLVYIYMHNVVCVCTIM